MSYDLGQALRAIKIISDGCVFVKDYAVVFWHELYKDGILIDSKFGEPFYYNLPQKYRELKRFYDL
jgi:hypothetical protein